MGRIKYEIRSKIKGKLVPIYLNYQDTNSHFRIKTEIKVKHEYWMEKPEPLTTYSQSKLTIPNQR